VNPIVTPLLALLAAVAPATPAPSAARSPDPAAPESGSTDADSSGAEDPEDVTKYQFTGLDIDGELRTPALLQFLSRIGGEFETVGIPHRSFMPELQATISEDAL
jgi:hypothetical protein